MIHAVLSALAVVEPLKPRNRKRAPERHATSVRLLPELIDAIDAIAGEESERAGAPISRAQVIEYALNLYVESRGKKP